MSSGLLSSEISDHLPICIICNKDILKDKQDESITFRKETPQNIQSFKNDLAAEVWTDVYVYSQRNADTAYENFNKKLQPYYDKTSL